MPKSKELTQEQIDWLLDHPRLNALLDRLLEEFDDIDHGFRRSSDQ